MAETRRAHERDATAIALLGRITFAETFGHLFRDHEHDLRAYLDATFDVAKVAAGLCKPENTFWLALARGLPIGYAKLKHPSPAPGLPAEDAAQLQKIYVLREFLGMRVGAALLAPLMKAAAEKSPRIWLDVLRDNDRAARFYERQGFASVAEDAFAIGRRRFLFTVMARHTR